MNHEQRAAAMRWIASAMADGFASEESFRVSEDGYIVVWLNEPFTTEAEVFPYTRIQFNITDIGGVTHDEFQSEYLRGERT